MLYRTAFLKSLTFANLDLACECFGLRIVPSTGLEPVAVGLCIPATTFAALDLPIKVCGLGYTFALRARRLVSRPSSEIREAWFGIAVLLSQLRFPRVWRVLQAHLKASFASSQCDVRATQF